MPSAASRSRLGVRYRSLMEFATRASICTEVPVQPWSSDRMRKMFCAAAGDAMPARKAHPTHRWKASEVSSTRPQRGEASHSTDLLPTSARDTGEVVARRALRLPSEPHPNAERPRLVRADARVAVAGVLEDLRPLVRDVRRTFPRPRRRRGGSSPRAPRGGARRWIAGLVPVTVHPRARRGADHPTNHHRLPTEGASPARAGRQYASVKRPGAIRCIPADAGLIRQVDRLPEMALRVPRGRGADPGRGSGTVATPPCSPRTRG